jgi:two-component system chemotaxis sensor kinase CheA
MTNLPDEDPYAIFKKTYFEECHELLEELEDKVTALDVDAIDFEDLNAIFRAVHSMKAGAGAFKFDRLVTFTHVFESVLDQMRLDELTVDQDVIEIMIRGGDVLADLVAAAEEGQEFDDASDTEVRELLEGLLVSADSGEPAKNSGVEETPSEAEDNIGNASACQTTYSISFRPGRELFRHANEPLRIIRELGSLGTLGVVLDCGSLPDFRTMEVEDAYFCWQLTLESACPRLDVEEIFEFVIDDCDLEIIEGGSETIDTPTLAAETDANSVAEEVPGAIQSEVSANPSVTPKPPSAAKAEKHKSGSKIMSIRVDLDRVDRLVNQVSEMVIAQSMVVQDISEALGPRAAVELQGLEDLALRTRHLQEGVMAIRMQPVKSVFSRMPRVVRDLSAKLGKKIELEMRGETTEVDKTVIEELGDPLTHMIRNSLDHGIESPEDRIAAGKPAVGTITLSAEHRSGRILIQVSDDGRGLDRERLLEKARERGVVAEDQTLTPEEIDALIFRPGFSTAKEVSEVSGRGVGMDVVRRNIQALGGRTAVDSEWGKGTTFTLTLPLTLAILDGMLISVGTQKYIMPLTAIVETVRPEPGSIRKLADGLEVMHIRGEMLRLVHLSKVFDVSGAQTEPTRALVILAELASGKKIGIVVDELLGQQQVVIKSMEENYKAIPGVSGATILGDGMVALIIDIDSFDRWSGSSPETRHNPDTESMNSEVLAAGSAELEEEAV